MQVEDIRSRPTISVLEAAQVCGIDKDTAYRAAQTGELPTLRFGRRIRVPVAALLRMLGDEGLKEKGPAANGARVLSLATDERKDSGQPTALDQ